MLDVQVHVHVEVHVQIMMQAPTFSCGIGCAARRMSSCSENNLYDNP
jgi:hypothetical protein